MNVIADTLRALRTVLTLQRDVGALRDAVASQGARLAALADAHAELRDRVSRLEGFIEGASAASRLPRIEG